MEQEQKKSRGGVAIAATFLLFFGAVIGPKIVDGAVNTYSKARQQILMNMILADLDGKSYAVDPKNKWTLRVNGMSEQDLLKALYVLDLRYRQSKTVIEGIRGAAQWDASIGVENE